MAEPLILTNVGLAKLASATPEDQLHIAAVAVGDGNGGYPPLDPSMTALVNEVWRGTASAPIRDPDNDAILIFETIIPPEDGGFFIREVGLFDADGDLIAIGQTGLVEKPSGGSGTPMTMTVRVRLALANASQTNLIINDAPYIDHQALTNRNASNAHPISSITGLQGALDGKLAIAQNLADLANVATARSNLGLGTAAVANVTTSPTDTTAGRVLRVGDFGLGTISPPLVTDLNDALANGIYRFIEDAANIPPVSEPSDGALFVFGAVPNNPGGTLGHLTQIAVLRPSGDFWVRSADSMDSNGDIEWGEWKNLWFDVATPAQAQAGTNDATVMTPAKTASLFPYRGIQVYDSPGTYTWKVPEGVTKAWVIVVGGGGPGGGAPATTASAPAEASGGGGGGTAIKLCDLTGVSSVPVTVAAAMQGPLGSNAGSNGNSSSFGEFCSATGGFPGQPGVPTTGTGGFSGGAGGVGIGGDINIPGGGGGASRVANGFYFGQSYGGGSYLSSPTRASTSSGDGVNGVGYGAGGGGARSIDAGNKRGGNGAPGIVIIQW